MKALIVDDSKTMVNMVALTLNDMGFDVTPAFDGVEAIEVAKGKKFDLVVTDINMPNMDGIELIRLLREEAECKSIPIIVLTTEGGDNAKEMGRQAGASGWIVKPFKPPVLRAAVTKLCKLNQ